jgi:maltooligosyltrehalose trehalohydrolase
MQLRIPDPADESTWQRSRLDWSERERNQQWVALHRDLLQLRRSDPVFRNGPVEIDGAVLSPEAFVLRFLTPAGDDRLIVVNLGQDLELRPCPEPLLAEPDDRDWKLTWSSEDPRYGGFGTPPVAENGDWFLPATSAVYFTATPRRKR